MRILNINVKIGDLVEYYCGNFEKIDKEYLDNYKNLVSSFSIKHIYRLDDKGNYMLIYKDKRR